MIATACAKGEHSNTTHPSSVKPSSEDNEFSKPTSGNLRDTVIWLLPSPLLLQPIQHQNRSSMSNRARHLEQRPRELMRRQQGCSYRFTHHSQPTFQPESPGKREGGENSIGDFFPNEGQIFFSFSASSVSPLYLINSREEQQKMYAH
ncbi:hypothetical protein CEXT_88011 [Caerostris extrusa]|uniref:Uncharacterized protein n=1 Tax=Caerostris extrusa TaxID=172846 RepID=A0AAV4SJJ1_CAEEX|nr:hypothetical protein CEXT_88011 [Caerostris extrusa]